MRLLICCFALSLGFKVKQVKQGRGCTHPTLWGDRVTFEITAYSPDIEKGFQDRLPPISDRAVRVTVDIGDYGVPYVNDGLLGMCVGDARKLTVPLGSTNIYYLIHLLDVSVRNRHEEL